MKRSIVRLIICVACMGMSYAWAEVPVSRSVPIDMTPAATLQANAQFELKIQQLESRLNEQAKQHATNVITLQQVMQEMQQLRGKVEEQDYQIQQLKKQVVSTYRDLDGRLMELQNNPDTASSNLKNSTTTHPVEQPETVSTSGSSANGADPAQQKARYEAGTNLLKKDDYAKAARAFASYLEDYPKGTYAANCHYWLGQIYYINNELDKSEQAFKMVLSQFSDSPKVADSMLKLADIYKDKQQLDKAKSLYNKVISQYPSSSAARLAKTKLQTM